MVNTGDTKIYGWEVWLVSTIFIFATTSIMRHVANQIGSRHKNSNGWILKQQIQFGLKHAMHSQEKML